MKNLFIIISIFALGSCSDQNNRKTNNQKENDEINNTLQLKNKISKNLVTCLPENWTAWEEYSEEKKTYLAHIGKGIYDLHFRANYELEDTLIGENNNRKDSNKYRPEITLHFYSNEESLKESVKFTQENLEIVSSINFAKDFGETVDFLIYECSTEKQIFQPKDNRMVEFRKCLIKKLTPYNKKINAIKTGVYSKHK